MEKENATTNEELMAKNKELQEENQYLRQECESVWAEMAKLRQQHLEIAQHIAATDSKNLANVLLNMYFGKMPTESVNLCEIFELKKYNRCGRFARCTDCIDRFLLDYADWRNRNMGNGKSKPLDQAEWPYGIQPPASWDAPSTENTSCDGCRNRSDTGRIPVACLSCRRPCAGKDGWAWKPDNYGTDQTTET